MKTIPSFALFALLFLVACNKDDDNDQSVNLNKSFEIDYRATTIFEDGDLSITFENLLEDSRCPEYATLKLVLWSNKSILLPNASNK